MHQRWRDDAQMARGEIAQMQDQVRKASRRALYNRLDWFDKLEARGRRILLSAASVLRVVGPNAAGLYLLCQRRERQNEETATVAAHGLADRITAWVDANAAALVILDDVGHDANYIAGRWLAEWSTFRWMLHMNSKGVAPSRRALVEEYCNQFPQPLLGSRARYHLDQVSICTVKARDWAVRFRRRWGVQHRRLQAGPSLSNDEIREKVRRSFVFKFSVCTHCALKVTLYLGWAQWLIGSAFANEDLIIVNMDESNIAHEYVLRAGHVTGAARRLRAGDPTQFRQRVNHSEMRSSLTLCAFIANDPRVQPSLPQVLLPRAKGQQPSVAERIAFAALPAPIRVWLGTNGWVNEDVFMQLVRELRQSVRRVRGEHIKVLLVVDAATQHISKRCLAYAARMQVYILIVPALLTWLLQMLDVYVFQKLKARIRQLQTNSRSASPSGSLEKHAWVHMVGRAVGDVLVDQDHSWTFARLGCEAGMPNLRADVAQYAPPIHELPIGPLNDEQICEMLGRRRVGISASLFNGPRRAQEGHVEVVQDPPAPFECLSGEAQLPRAARLLGRGAIR